MQRILAGGIYLLLAVCLAVPLPGQSEASLKACFEGKQVLVKLDMPATSDGIDLDMLPDGEFQTNLASYTRRIRDYGVALREGDSVMVTKIKVKKDLIEFQLGGGGYGVFGDMIDPTVTYIPAAKSQREKDLEDQVDQEQDHRRLRELRKELNDLRLERERENDRRSQEAAEQTAINAENIRQKRSQGGSRFNLRFGKITRADLLTPDGLMAALDNYLTFPWRVDQAAASKPDSAPLTPAGKPTGSAELRKGMSYDEVVNQLGEPISTANRVEGTLKILSCVFETADRRISADFIEGTLVKFTIESR